MRALEEIEAEVRHASIAGDVQALQHLVRELDGHDAPTAEALKESAHGYICSRTGALEQSLDHFQRALEAFEKHGHVSGTAQATGNLAMVHQKRCDYPSALVYLRRALFLYEELQEGKGLAGTHLGFGHVFERLADYPRAMKHLHVAVEMFAGQGLEDFESYARFNLAILYVQTGDVERGLQLLQYVLDYYTRKQATDSLAETHDQIGAVCNRMGDSTSALEHLETAHGLYADLPPSAKSARATVNLAMILIDVNEIERARTLLHEASAIDQRYPSLDIAIEDTWSKIHERQEDLSRAWDHALTALDLAQQREFVSETVGCHLRLRDLAKKRGDFDGYIKHNEEHLRLNEEIRGTEATQKLAVMEVERTIEVERQEREKERALLYGALPKHIADRIIRGDDVSGDKHENVAILFLDITGSTRHSDTLDPTQVVGLLSSMFTTFDDICETYGLTKIKTIGDAYMAVAFPDIGDRRSDVNPVQRAAHAAVAMLDSEFTWPSAIANSNGDRVQFRIGLHCGPVVAGVIGKQRLQYDVWRDTVNVASRMESTGEPGRIQVSSEFHEQLSSRARSPVSALRSLKFTERGEVNIKGKGAMTTYWLEGAL